MFQWMLRRLLRPFGAGTTEVIITHYAHYVPPEREGTYVVPTRARYYPPNRRATYNSDHHTAKYVPPDRQAQYLGELP